MQTTTFRVCPFLRETRLRHALVCVVAALVFSHVAAVAAEPAAADVNRAFGVVLLSEESFWSEAPGPVASRLGLQPLSRTDATATWSGSGRWFGMPVAEVVLRAQGDRVSELVVTVENKGDFFAPANLARLVHGEELQDTLRRDGTATPRTERELARLFESRLAAAEQKIETALTRLLGSGRRVSLRIGGDRERVTVWRWRDVAFLLDARDEEYVALRVVPPDLVDARGRQQVKSDRDLGRALRENVVTQGNGDVLVTNIPHVDQGKKGYCAAAAGERLLRYVGIPGDVHVLARLAETSRYGGTDWRELVAALTEIASRHRRSVVTRSGRLSMRAIQRCIDEGLPLLWCMYVTDAMEVVAERRAAQRPDSRDGLSGWRRRLQREARETRRIEPDPAGGHARLIVGYNEATEEIAYSDTWGSSRTVLWVTLDEANRVHADEVCWIRP